jgi:hypothetical protein
MISEMNVNVAPNLHNITIRKEDDRKFFKAYSELFSGCRRERLSFN